MENAFPQKPRRSWVRDRGAHRVGLDQPPAVSRAHGQCHQSQQGHSHTSQSPRARAQNRKRKAGTMNKAHGRPHGFPLHLQHDGKCVIRPAFPAAFVARWKMRSHKNHWSWVRERIGQAGPATGWINRTWSLSPEPARPESHEPDPESPSAEPQSAKPGP